MQNGDESGADAGGDGYSSGTLSASASSSSLAAAAGAGAGAGPRSAAGSAVAAAAGGHEMAAVFDRAAWASMLELADECGWQEVVVSDWNESRKVGRLGSVGSQQGWNESRKVGSLRSMELGRSHGYIPRWLSLTPPLLS
jgi:hypothetical protein